LKKTPINSSCIFHTIWEKPSCVGFE